MHARHRVHDVLQATDHSRGAPWRPRCHRTEPAHERARHPGARRPLSPGPAPRASRNGGRCPASTRARAHRAQGTRGPEHLVHHEVRVRNLPHHRRGIPSYAGWLSRSPAKSNRVPIRRDSRCFTTSPRVNSASGRTASGKPNQRLVVGSRLGEDEELVQVPHPLLGSGSLPRIASMRPEARPAAPPPPRPACPWRIVADVRVRVLAVVAVRRPSSCQSKRLPYVLSSPGSHQQSRPLVAEGLYDPLEQLEFGQHRAPRPW